METKTKIIILTVVFAVCCVIPVVFADSIFVGMSEAGIVRLDDNLGFKAFHLSSGGVTAIELSSDLQQLYCAVKSQKKPAVLDPVTLGDITTPDTVQDNLIGMKLGSKIYISPNGTYIYAIGNEAKPASLYITDGETNKLLKVISIDTVPSKVIFAEDESYAIVLSETGNKIYKIEHNDFNIVKEKRLPKPTACCIVSANIGEPETIYSNGNIVSHSNIVPQKNLVQSSSGLILLSTIFHVYVVAPAQGDIWKGVQNIFYVHDYMGEPDPGRANIICYDDSNQPHILYDSMGQSSQNLTADGWFEWNTAAFPDTGNAVVQVNVYYQGSEGMGQSGVFAADNTTPQIAVLEPGSISNNLRQPFVADVTDNYNLKEAKLAPIDVVPNSESGPWIYTKDLSGLLTERINWSGLTQDLIEGNHFYTLYLWDMAGNVRSVRRDFFYTPDIEPPRIVFSIPSNLYTTTADLRPELSAVVTDDKGLKSVKLLFKISWGPDRIVYSDGNLNGALSKPVSYKPSINLPSGTSCKYTVIAEDKVGHITTQYRYYLISVGESKGSGTTSTR